LEIINSWYLLKDSKSLNHISIRDHKLYLLWRRIRIPSYLLVLILLHRLRIRILNNKQHSRTQFTYILVHSRSNVQMSASIDNSFKSRPLGGSSTT
jgi:hypothetical protein